MPVLIPAVVGAAASYAATTGVFGFVAGTFASGLIGGLASLAVSNVLPAPRKPSP